MATLFLLAPAAQAQLPLTNILAFAKTTDVVTESEGVASVMVVRRQGLRGRILVDVALLQTNAPGFTNVTGWTAVKTLEMIDYQLSTNFTFNVADNLSTNANTAPAQFRLINPRVAPGEDPFLTPQIAGSGGDTTAITVINNDHATTFTLSKVNNSTTEGSPVAPQFIVTLGMAPSAVPGGVMDVSVDYTVEAIAKGELGAGAAMAGSTDFVAASGTIQFTDTASVAIDLPNTPDDTELEFPEEYKITLSNARGAKAADNTNNIPAYALNTQTFARMRIEWDGTDDPPAGAVDRDFNPDNNSNNNSLRNPGANGPVSVIKSDSQDRTYVGGSFSSVNATPRSGIARLIPNTQAQPPLDGAIDPTFAPSGVELGGTVSAIEFYDANSPLNFDKIAIGGSFSSVNGRRYNSVARLLENGAVDTTFNVGEGADGPVYAIGVEGGDTLIVAGDFENFDAVARGGLARLNSDGSLDRQSFQNISIDGPVFSVLIERPSPMTINSQSVTNTTNSFEVTIPIPFRSGDLVFRVNAFDDPDDIEILFGGVNVFSRQQFTNNFTLVTDPNTGAVTTNWAIRTFPIRLGPLGTAPNDLVIRFNPNGNTNGTSFTFSGDITFSETRSITIGGDFRSVDAGNGPVLAPGVARFNASGALDPLFMANLGSGADGPVNTLALQSDRKIIVGGGFRFFNNVFRGGITRLEADGTPDLSFATGGGASGSVLSAHVDRDDGDLIYLAGEFLEFNGTRRRMLTRLFPNGAIDTSFMDSAYNQYAGFPNVNGIAGNGPEGYLSSVSLDSNGGVLVGGLFNLVGSTETRTSTRPRQNFARLIGGSTPGPGNMEFREAVSGVDENGGVKPVGFIRTNGNLARIVATVQTFDAAAVANQDYVPVNNGLTGFPAVGTDDRVGSTAIVNVNVQIIDENPPVIEGDEDFLMDIVRIQGELDLGGEIIRPDAALGPVTDTRIVILENDVEPTTISFARPEFDVDEDDLFGTVEVYRTGNPASRVTIDYIANLYTGTAGPAATPGVDFIAVTNTLVFAPGQTNRTFQVQIRDDEPTELDERIGLRLLRPTGGAVLNTNANTAVLNLIDNDLPSGKLDFTSSTYSGTEGQPFIELQVRRAGGNVGFLTVDFTTAPETAVTPGDFITTTGTLTWNDQDISTKTIRIPITNDFEVETNETFRVRLINPSQPGIIGNLHENPVVTIVDDDFYGQFSFSVADYFTDEDGTDAVIQVIRRNGQAGQVSVNYETTAGTATPGVDYTNVTGTLTFAPGETAKTFIVPIVDDLALETNETVILTLNSPVLGSLGPRAISRLVILDNENLAIPAGDVDKDFAIGDGANGPVYAIALQNDNATNSARRIVIAGDFTEYNRAPRGRVARLTDSGFIDTRYAENLVIDGPVRAILATPDGKVVIGGDFTEVDGVPVSRIGRLNAVGHRDSLFNIGAGADGAVNALAETFVMSGTNRLSRIVVGGGFTVINSVSRPRLALVGNDGKVDLNFDTKGGPDAPVTAVAAQRDNRIVVAGSFTRIGTNLATRIARMNLDGSVDTTFNSGSGVDGIVHSIVIQADDKIVIGGDFATVNGVTRNGVARLNVDGSVDTTFNPGTGANGSVRQLALQIDGKIVVVGTFTTFNGMSRPRITRLLPDGQNDVNINFGSGANDTIEAVAVQYDRKIVIGGHFTEVNGFPRNRVARLFGGSVRGSGRIEFFLSDYDVQESEPFATVIVQRFGGTEGAASVEYFSSAETAVPGSDYMDVSGRLDFGPGETVRLIQVPILDDNLAEGEKTILITLTNVTGAVIGRQPIARVRIQSDDAVISFSQDRYVVNEATQGGRMIISVVRQGDLTFTASADITVTGGTATPTSDYNFTSQQVIFTPGESVRQVVIPIVNDTTGEGDETIELTLTTSGGGAFPGLAATTIVIEDDDFSPGLITFESATAAVLEDNGIVRINVRRTSGSQGTVSIDVNTLLGTASTNDVTTFQGTLVFTNTQTTNSFEIQMFEDKLVEAPETLTFILSNPTGGAAFGVNRTLELTISDDDLGPGSLDVNFNPRTANGEVHDIALQPDGKVVVGGAFTIFDGQSARFVTRLQPDGTRDTTFSVGAGPSGPVYAVDMADQGKITIGGDFRSVSAQDRLYLARLLPSGILDPSQNFPTELNNAIRTLQFQQDTKVLIGGDFTIPATRLARINASGSHDVSFNTQGGADARVLDIRRAPDGKVLVAGEFTNIGGVVRPGVVRLLNNGLIDTNFAVNVLPGSVGYQTLPLAGGRVLVAGDLLLPTGLSRLTMFNNNGTVDTNFMVHTNTTLQANVTLTVNGPVYALALHDNGTILVAGDFSAINGEPRNRLARLTADGELDTTFNPALSLDGAITEVIVQPDGNLLVAGLFTEINGFPRPGVARLNGRQPLPPPAVITSVSQSASDVRITFTSEPDVTYEIESTTDFITWRVDRTVTAAATTTTVNLPITDTYRFFRVTARPQ